MKSIAPFALVGAAYAGLDGSVYVTDLDDEFVESVPILVDYDRCDSSPGCFEDCNAHAKNGDPSLNECWGSCLCYLERNNTYASSKQILSFNDLIFNLSFNFSSLKLITIN